MPCPAPTGNLPFSLSSDFQKLRKDKEYINKYNIKTQNITLYNEKDL